MTAMDITIHASFLPHNDPDASLAFYRDRPEVVPVVLLSCGLGPVKTNGQREIAIRGDRAVDFRTSRSSFKPDNPDQTHDFRSDRPTAGSVSLTRSLIRFDASKLTAA